MPIRVVFVDDSKSILKTIEILLKTRVQNGEITVHTFSRATDFLETIKSNLLEFDLIFLDINMPVFSGYDLLKTLREIERYREIPVVALTTENTEEAIKKGGEIGFSDWIIKINAPNTLLEAINTAIDKYGPKKTAKDDATRARPDTQNLLDEINSMFATIEELNKKLLKAEEDKSRFLSLIHNEFNNPLMAVTMLMRDIIEDKTKSRDEIIESIGMIFSDILILNSQLSNILAAAEIEATSGMSKYLSKFDIQNMINDIIDTQQFIHKEKSIETEISLSLPETIYNDCNKCFLIFRNLIENAFEFSPKKGRVSIKGVVKEDNIVFSIANTGNHIKDQDRMYDPFYHERSDFSRVHHGLGLGLAIVKHMVNFLGGSILYRIEDETNFFEVLLPLDPNKPAVECEDISKFVFSDNEGKTF